MKQRRQFQRFVVHNSLCPFELYLNSDTSRSYALFHTIGLGGCGVLFNSEKKLQSQDGVKLSFVSESKTFHVTGQVKYRATSPLNSHQLLGVAFHRSDDSFKKFMHNFINEGVSDGFLVVQPHATTKVID